MSVRTGKPPGGSTPDTRRPPFACVDGQSAAAAGAEIAAALEALAAEPDTLQWVERHAMRPFARAAADDAAVQASSRAARDIAAAIDAEAAQADRNPYHNRQHFGEVVLVAGFLARLHRLPPRDAQRLLLAALIHDLDHDGRPGGDFVNERRSIERATPLLVAAGVAADERRRLAALVLATETHCGTGAALAAVAGEPSAAPPSAPELDALAHDAGLARLAALLCEADLLPSAGLTAAHAQTLQRRLADEWRRPLGVDDKRRFLDRLLAEGIVGDFFAPNVRALRAALAVDCTDAAARR